jgi:hypothetical protein
MVFKFVWEILPVQPTIQAKNKICTPPLFLGDENIFQNSASVVLSGIVTEFVPRRLISWKIISSSKKRGC